MDVLHACKQDADEASRSGSFDHSRLRGKTKTGVDEGNVLLEAREVLEARHPVLIQSD